MKRPFPVLRLAFSLVLLLGLIAGCTRSARSRLIGIWEADVGKLAEDMKAENPAAAALAAGLSVTFDLAADGSVTLRNKTPMGDNSLTGTWAVVHEEGDEARLEVRLNDQDAQEISIRFLDADTFEIKNDSGINVPSPRMRRRK